MMIFLQLIVAAGKIFKKQKQKLKCVPQTQYTSM